jgi:uncharacterized protein with gpF-like domain
MVLSAEKIDRMVRDMEPALAAAFFSSLRLIRDKFTLALLEELISRGAIDQAIKIAEQAAQKLGTAWTMGYNRAGQEAAEALGRAVADIVIDFDITNWRAVEVARENQLRLVREFSDEQRAVTRDIIRQGVQDGENPRVTARKIRESIGLTRKQQQSVENFRRMLETRDRTALTRALRDRRFDPTIERAIRSGRPLTEAQIDNMVDRYRERMLKMRAETIARTEALRAVNQATHQMFNQAVEMGLLQQNNIIQEWNTAKDERVRGTHQAMHGQIRPFGVPFTTGSGASLMYPGDPAGPARETINCRCAVGTRLRTVEGIGGVNVTVLDEIP